MDLSRLSDADLLALKSGDISKVSTEGLQNLKGAANPERRAPAKAAQSPEALAKIEEYRQKMGSLTEGLGPIANMKRLGEEGLASLQGLGNSVRQGANFVMGRDNSELKAERKAMDAENDKRAADDPFNYMVRGPARLASDIAFTAPVGGALAAPIKGLGALAPSLSRATAPVAEALSTFGGSTGLAPASVAGKAGNLALRSAGGAAAGGVAGGLVSPEDPGLSAVIGGSLPVVGAGLSAAGGAVGNFIAPRTQKGAERISNEIIKKAAADPAAVAQRLANPPKSSTPLTLNEVADDRGIGSLYNTLRNKNEDFKIASGLRDDVQNSARFNELFGLSGGDAGIEALKANRKQITDPLIDAALKNAGEVGTMGVRSKVKEIADSGALNRKVVKNAVGEAIEPFNMGTAAEKQWAKKLPFGEAWFARQNIDDILEGANNKVNERAAGAAKHQLGEVRARLSTALEKASPDFKRFSDTYAQESTKVDAAKFLLDITKKSSLGGRDPSGNPYLSAAQLQQALKSMKPEDWNKLSQSQKDSVLQMANELSTAVRVKAYGTIPGQSATAANLYGGSNLSLAGVPGFGRTSQAVGLLGRGIDALMPNQVPGLLGQKLLDPAMGARAFQAPQGLLNQPSLMPELLYRSSPALLSRE